MLDRTIAFARCQFDIRHRDVVVKIDKAHLALGNRRQAPHRVQRISFGRAERQGRRCARLFEAGFLRRLAPRRCAAGKAALKGKDAVCRARRRDRLARFAGYEAGLFFVEIKLAAGLREQVNGGIPAAGETQQVAAQSADIAGETIALVVERQHFDAAQAF